MVSLGMGWPAIQPLYDHADSADLADGCSQPAGRAWVVPDEVLSETHIAIGQDTDVVVACQQGRTLAANLGLPASGQTAVTIAIAEVARNIVNYARQGRVTLRLIRQGSRQGIVVLAMDQGPGIADISRAMQDGYTTGKGLGLGLSGAKRLMDEFEIISEVGKGTTVTMKKWKA